MRVTFQLDNLEEIEPWVLSWGGHATVVRPRQLADRVVGAARTLIAHYDNPAPAPAGIKTDSGALLPWGT